MASGRDVAQEPPAVSVLIPTIGRPAQLSQCLAALANCSPRAQEIVVVDQSADPAVAEVIEAHGDAGARRIGCSGLGQARALNVGLRAVRNETVLITDDDCVAAPDWVAVGAARGSEDPAAIVTGRVLPGEGPGVVPSTIEDPLPRDYRGDLRCGVLYTGNMVCHRQALLDFGGFDERLDVSALDNDLCYRWLRAGRRLCYRPDLVVSHLDWRSPAQLRALNVDYSVGQWMMYLKHVLGRDRAILPFVTTDTRHVARVLVTRVLRGPLPIADYRWFMVLGLPRGLRLGWQAFGRGRKAPSGRG